MMRHWVSKEWTTAVRLRTARMSVVAFNLYASVTMLAAAEDWKADWEVLPGFSLAIDVEDFDYPSSIAFVPNPGKNPKDPLYFVTELFGKVKVVANDRTVHTFAEGFFSVNPTIPPPSTFGEIGMAGIALDPAHGYVFVSYVYHDQNKVLRNSVMRFQSTPGTFGLKANGSKSFAHLFEAESAWINYHIGPMVVDGDQLYVNLGDGGKPFNSQNPDFTVGKVLRMTLDGEPVRDNPFTVDDDPKKTRNYVWALGFRNPFGLAKVNGRMFVSENGVAIDRFMEVEKGGNYLWDGTDWSIGTNAAVVFGPTVGPVQLAWLPTQNAVFPEEFRSKFYLAMSFGQNMTTGVSMLDFDFAKSKMASPPRKFLHLRPEPGGHVFRPDVRIQKVVGTAFGPDGLYVLPLYPVRKDAGAKAPVLRISYDPNHAHTGIIDRDRTAESMMVRLGCWACHSPEKDRLRMAPPLDSETLVSRLSNQLHSDQYRKSLEEIEKLDAEPYRSFRDARKQLMAVTGKDRVREWIKYRLITPTFDRVSSAMPQFGLSESDSRIIADYLVERDQPAPASIGEKVKRAIKSALPEQPKRRHLAVAAGLGFGAGVMLLGVIALLRRIISRRRTSLPGDAA